jgi:hypothetical protein
LHDSTCSIMGELLIRTPACDPLSPRGSASPLLQLILDPRRRHHLLHPLLLIRTPEWLPAPGSRPSPTWLCLVGLQRRPLLLPSRFIQVLARLCLLGHGLQPSRLSIDRSPVARSSQASVLQPTASNRPNLSPPPFIRPRSGPGPDPVASI